MNETRYNNAQPFVLVDTSGLDVSGGDAHGYLGLGQRLSEKLSAKFVHLRAFEKKILGNEIKEFADHVHAYNDILSSHGYPDFVLGIPVNTAPTFYSGDAKGIILNIINESVCQELGVRTPTPWDVPHNLTKEKLRSEGARFVEVYGKKDAPLVALHLIATHPVDHNAGQIARIITPLEKATVFACTMRRTADGTYTEFMKYLSAYFKRAASDIRLLGWDYRNEHQKSWNPYVGLLDQADHHILLGASDSILSEIHAAGRKVHAHNYSSSSLKSIFYYASGEAIETEPFTPFDINGACADKLIELHKKHIQTGVGYRNAPEVKRS